FLRCCGARSAFRFRHVAVADRAPGGGPFVAVEGLEITERFAHFRRLELGDRIGVAVGALLDVGLELGQGARAADLSEGGGGEREKQGERERLAKCAAVHDFFPVGTRRIISQREPRRLRSRVLSILDKSMDFEPKSLSSTGGIPEGSRREPEPELGDAETREISPFISRRFVIGSLLAFGILVANAFVTYRTIANLIEASRIAENTLKVVEALKDVQGDVADSQIELRGYIISGERERLERARAFLERGATRAETLRALS